MGSPGLKRVGLNDFFTIETVMEWWFSLHVVFVGVDLVVEGFPPCLCYAIVMALLFVYLVLVAIMLALLFDHFFVSTIDMTLLSGCVILFPPWYVLFLLLLGVFSLMEVALPRWAS